MLKILQITITTIATHSILLFGSYYVFNVVLTNLYDVSNIENKHTDEIVMLYNKDYKSLFNDL